MKKLLLLIVSMVVMPAMAQRSFNMDLYAGQPSVESSDNADTARITVYLPRADKATGKAILICPGGGYSHLAMNHEGHEWAKFFNNMGIAAVVLKYRMPHGEKAVPRADAETAMKIIRQNASAWNINSNKVGIMGFSAGGHLAATVATLSKGDAKPDFQLLFYPVITMQPGFTHKGSHDCLLGKDAKKSEEKQLSLDLQVTRTTPKAFIVLSDDDTTVLPANGTNYYFELYRHDVPAALHVYPSGGHGWGMRSSFAFHTEMLMEVKAWLATL